ncbi:hypothetical protein TVAG_431060 [Trichomonas vaginalis G3]|uniref:DUF3447 domain-containing protein n=1 Tax=Trichomonas vaginalis (strain ATCC PRA-98 / G3) TaxID=412133 RepID=A2EZE4_TRIV3|nr:spectrin binding [Trichomonas vaginalis G3]EAY01965.1 hypothetical protein TVAG_431060 [Trichomonas vaginalis G3]KAI5523029.1 spectrin binding [Trichomonas vaginalis G3]|eukprot:XP_001330806.1 hypothetical protein [Trichomonas vaginalis G3]
MPENFMKYAFLLQLKPLSNYYVTFMMNEYDLEIGLDYCGLYNNKESFLIYFDQINDINKCFINSARFDIPSLLEYFLSHGSNIV